MEMDVRFATSKRGDENIPWSVVGHKGFVGFCERDVKVRERSMIDGVGRSFSQITPDGEDGVPPCIRW